MGVHSESERTVRKKIKDLEAAGFIYYTANEKDARVKRVLLTEMGTKFVRDIENEYGDSINRIRDLRKNATPSPFRYVG